MQMLLLVPLPCREESLLCENGKVWLCSDVVLLLLLLLLAAADNNAQGDRSIDRS